MSTEKFSIEASTRTIKENSKQGNAILLDETIKYIIPVYQRPYSWGEKEVKKFVTDIFASFWGYDGENSSEPMFIGTMQLSSKNQNNEQDVIDGQQRITTMLLLLKVLQLKYPNKEVLRSLRLDCLVSKVNNGSQHQQFQEVINASSVDFNDHQNTFNKNLKLISDLVESKIHGNEDMDNAKIDEFLTFLFSQIHFVVIETHAGLSKTIQIFDSINTSGLDLNGSDLFKIRMYEYLRDKKQMGESAFDKINELYSKIEEGNKKLGVNQFQFNAILALYKHIIICKYKMPTVLHDARTEDFFERLFESIFHIQEWEHYKSSASKVELSLEELNLLIDTRHLWLDNVYKTLFDAFNMQLIWASRYNRYWTLSLLFIYQYSDQEDVWNKLRIFNKQLSKLFFIYSVRFSKVVNEMHTFIYSLMKKILDSSMDESIALINDKIGHLEDHKDDVYDLSHALSESISGSSKRKNLICGLSAFLEKPTKDHDFNDFEGDVWAELIFPDEFDIEHIQSVNDEDATKRAQVLNEWGDELHSIGNLMVLESNINRSISNSIYSEKRERYLSSNYEIVKKLANDYAEWNLESCKKRKKHELNKIITYLF